MRFLFFYLILIFLPFSSALAQKGQNVLINDTTLENLDLNVSMDTLIFSFNEGQVPDTIPVYNKLVRSGELLFTEHCKSCHGVKRALYGPPLASVHRKKPISWLFRFIRNPAKVMEEGDEYAQYLLSQYDTLMPSFDYLSDDQIFAILAYIKSESSYEPLPVDEASIASGRQLFSTYCYQCHAVGKQKFGPALASVYKRRGLPWLMHFIRNSQEVILSGDPYANFLYERYNNMVMPSFEFLKDDDILNILAYVKESSEPPFNYQQYASRIHTSVDWLQKEEAPEKRANIDWMIYGLLGLILILGLVLAILVFRILSVRMKKNNRSA